MVKQASVILFAYLYIDNLDHNKYGLIIQHFFSHKSLRNDQYLRKIVETNNMWSNHKFDKKREKKKDHKHPKANKNNEDR